VLRIVRVNGVIAFLARLWVSVFHVKRADRRVVMDDEIHLPTDDGQPGIRLLRSGKNQIRLLEVLELKIARIADLCSVGYGLWNVCDFCLLYTSQSYRTQTRENSSKNSHKKSCLLWIDMKRLQKNRSTN